MSRSGVLGMQQFPTGRWPDQISFDQALDTYLWSLGSVRQIQALDHIHVVNFDQDGADPYTMELILPVMENLPAGARMYFFYVSRCHDHDVLQFSTVALSGDTVNGMLGTYPFVLNGDKTLFVCVGVKGNYIVHPINIAIPNVHPPSSAIPGLFFKQSAPGLPLTFNYQPYPTVEPNVTMFSTGVGHYSAGIPVGDTSKVGAIVPNNLIPTKTVYGFRCVSDPGFWGITYHSNYNCAFNITDVHLGNDIIIVGSDGTTIKYWVQSAHITVGTAVGSYVGVRDMNEVKLPLDIGDYIFIAPNYFGNISAVGVNNIWNYSYATFLYYGPYDPVAPPAAPLLALRSASSSSSSSVDAAASASNEIVMGSAIDTPQKRKALHKKLLDEQKQETQKRKDRQLSFANQQFDQQQQPAQAPSFTLADVENIVRKVMSSASVAPSPPQQVDSAVDSSSSSESLSQALPPPPRKRTRTGSISDIAPSSGESESDVILVKK